MVFLQMQYSKSDGGVAPKYDDGEDMVRQLQANQTGIDAKLHQSQINLFSHQQPLTEDHFDSQNGELSFSHTHIHVHTHRRSSSLCTASQIQLACTIL